MTDAPPQQLQSIRELLAALPDLATSARTGSNPWSFIDKPSVRPAGSGLPESLDQVGILDAADRIDRAVAALPTEHALGVAVAAASTPEDLKRVADVVAAPPLPLPVVDAARSPVWRDDAGQAITTLALLLANAKSELVDIDPRFVDLPIADLHREAVDADVAGVFARRHRRSAVLEALAEVVPPGRRPRGTDLSAFTGRLLSFSDRVAAVRLAFSRITGLEPQTGWNPLTERHAGRLHRIKEWAEWLSEVLDPAAPLGSPAFHTGLRGAYVESTGLDAGSSALLIEAQESFDELASMIGVAGEALAHAVTVGTAAVEPDGESDGGPVGESGGEPVRTGLVAGWLSPARDPRGSGPLLLSRWVALLEHLEPLRTYGLHEMRDDALTGRLDPALALAVIDRELENRPEPADIRPTG